MVSDFLSALPVIVWWVAMVLLLDYIDRQPEPEPPPRRVIINFYGQPVKQIPQSDTWDLLQNGKIIFQDVNPQQGEDDL